MGMLLNTNSLAFHETMKGGVNRREPSGSREIEVAGHAAIELRLLRFSSLQ